MEIKHITFELLRVTENAALAAYQTVGMLDKNLSDMLAVKAMRQALNDTYINGEIVIGEGVMDDAPMLYNGEKVGCGELEIDIAVDPVDGTSNVSVGRSNSISVLAVANKGCLLKAPDMYMLKIATGPKSAAVIDITKSLTDNIYAVAKALDKQVSDVGIALLERSRHDKFVEEIKKLGARVFLFKDGDIATAVQTCMPNSNIDILYGYGGAPEGVIAAVALKAMGGSMQAKLVHYDLIWPNDTETAACVKREKAELKKLKVDAEQILLLDDLVIGDDYVFACTGITKCDLLDGVYYEDGVHYTESLLIRGKTKTTRKIVSSHDISKKPEELKVTLNYIKNLHK